MRVSDLRPTGTGQNGPTRRNDKRGGRFEVAGESSHETARLRTSAPISGVDALVALQTFEEAPGERKQAAMRQGREVLDLLDEIKLALLAGDLSAAKLARLEQALARRPACDDDPRLRDLLAQIELRARVELAKLGRRAA